MGTMRSTWMILLVIVAACVVTATANAGEKIVVKEKDIVVKDKVEVKVVPAVRVQRKFVVHYETKDQVRQHLEIEALSIEEARARCSCGLPALFRRGCRAKIHRCV